MNRSQITENLNKMRAIARKACEESQAVIRAYDDQKAKEHMYGIAIFALLLLVGALQ